MPDCKIRSKKVWFGTSARAQVLAAIRCQQKEFMWALSPGRSDNVITQSRAPIPSKIKVTLESAYHEFPMELKRANVQASARTLAADQDLKPDHSLSRILPLGPPSWTNCVDHVPVGKPIARCRVLLLLTLTCRLCSAAAAATLA